MIGHERGLDIKDLACGGRYEGRMLFAPWRPMGKNGRGPRDAKMILILCLPALKGLREPRILE